MDALKDWWPIVLSAIAAIAYVARIETRQSDQFAESSKWRIKNDIENAEWRVRHDKAISEGFHALSSRMDDTNKCLRELNGKVYRHEGEIARLMQLLFTNFDLD